MESVVNLQVARFTLNPAGHGGTPELRGTVREGVDVSHMTLNRA